MRRYLAVAVAVVGLWCVTTPAAAATDAPVLSCAADGTAYCAAAGGSARRALTPAGPRTLEGAPISPVAPPPPTYGMWLHPAATARA